MLQRTVPGTSGSRAVGSARHGSGGRAGQATSLGGELPTTYVVGCVPADLAEGIGLSPAVAAAVPKALAAVGEPSLGKKSFPIQLRRCRTCAWEYRGGSSSSSRVTAASSPSWMWPGWSGKSTSACWMTGRRKPGSWVLIHMGFALERVDAAGAEQAMNGLELMGRPSGTGSEPPPGSRITGKCRQVTSEEQPDVRRRRNGSAPRVPKPAAHRAPAPGTARAWGSEPPVKEPAQPGRRRLLRTRRWLPKGWA